MKISSNTFPKQLRDPTSIMWQLVVYGEEDLVLSVVVFVFYALGNQQWIFGGQWRESITGNLLHLNMLEVDHEEAKCIVDYKEEMRNSNQIFLRSGTCTDNGVEFVNSHLLNIPFDLLEMIMELCVGVEYMNFRATCKQCLLAAPLIKWSNEASLRRLQTHSPVSPWLMKQTWRGLRFGTDPHTVCFSAFYGGDLFVFCEQEVIVINNLGKEDCSREEAEAEDPKGYCKCPTQYFITNCDEHRLLVGVGEYGEAVEVFEHNESKQIWEKIDSVG
nr:hypothetical protein CTI12_AA475860 [Tanacetum cinerariifolium]